MGRVSRAIWRCAAIASIVVLSAPVLAQEGPAAKVYVDFEGGLTGKNMADVISAFGPPADILPTRVVLPEQTQGICWILRAELKMPVEACTEDLIRSVVNLGRRSGIAVNPNAVSSARGAVLPDVVATTTDIKRLYNLSEDTEAERLDQILKNPGWGNAIEQKDENLLQPYGKDVPRLDQLTIKRISWEFSINDPLKVAEAALLARKLSNRNLTIDVERGKGFDKKAHSQLQSAATVFKNWCVDKLVNDQEGSFAEMAGQLYNTDQAVTCESDQVRPEVVIIDQPVLKHPDLAKALSLASAATTLPPLGSVCDGPKDYDGKTGHGTLLSTIVAAEKNGYGFVGLAPDAAIEEIAWDKKEFGNRYLQDKINDKWEPVAPQVFLFASEFAPYGPPPPPGATDIAIENAKETWKRDAAGNWLDLLANEDVRLEGGLVKDLLQSDLLMVASAGQALPNEAPLKIGAETPMSPQNLGDHDHVLVTAACTNCESPSAKLWKESNRDANQAKRRFVSVMAPGGGDIPTYVSDKAVGKVTGGTSAAAAFTAGLAARMFQCYPSSYRGRPERLKERIILASRPVKDPDVADGIAGGVIDPQVSMLDPGKTWLKLKTQDVRPVTFRRWCRTLLKLQDDNNGRRHPLLLPGARRLSDVDNVGLVYQSVDKLQNERYVKHTVRREAPATPQDQERVAAVQYDDGAAECAVSLSRLTDLFLDKDYDTEGDCSTVPLCN